MKQQLYECDVIDIVNETDAVRRFYIKYPDDVNLNFKAGQFAIIDMPIEGKYTHREYSIASPPDSNNIIELCIVLNPEGAGTRYLFDYIKPGSKLNLTMPIGKFTLPETIEDDICFICTGTGIAPLRSMALYILNQNIPYKSMHMIFGNRYKGDILYHKEMQELHEQHENFHFYPVLSRETHETWDGHKGYVHNIYEDIFADRRPATFYICGWKAMLTEARQRLEAMGYDRKRIKFESYD